MKAFAVRLARIRRKQGFKKTYPKHIYAEAVTRLLDRVEIHGEDIEPSGSPKGGEILQVWFPLDLANRLIDWCENRYSLTAFFLRAMKEFIREEETALKREERHERAKS